LFPLNANQLDKEQRDALPGIIREYVFNLEYEKATAAYDKIIKRDWL